MGFSELIQNTEMGHDRSRFALVTGEKVLVSPRTSSTYDGICQEENMSGPQMEQREPSRVSSGIYYQLHDPSDVSLLRSLNEPQIPSAAHSQVNVQEQNPFGDENAIGAAPQRPGEHAVNTDGILPGAGTAAAAVSVPFYRFYRKPGWYKSRKFLICQGITAAIGIAMIFVLLWPVVKAIAQHVVNVSVLNIDTAQITEPTNSSFMLAMQGVVSWKINGSDIPLGTINLSPLQASHKRATINQTTLFQISDEDAFGTFTEAMITQPNFTWHLKSEGLRVNALKFPVATGIHFDKEVTLNGINSFDGNVKLVDFQLPSDSPNGGINFIAETQLNNTSPFKVDLGTVQFDLSYNDTFLGTGTGVNSQIQPGAVNITLDGVLVPHNDSTDALASLSSLFTAYLNGDSSPVIATGRSTLLPPHNTSIPWLSKGIQALRLKVPFKNPDEDGPLGPIKSITIGDMALAFNESDPWNPIANSRSVQAYMKLPFGFGMSIGEIANGFNISQNNSVVGGLSTPLGSSTSDIKVLGQTDTEGTINISIVDTALRVPDSQRSVFSQFNMDLTNLQESQFQLIGHARAVANLSVGQITLDPINFNVTSKLDGLRGLKGDTTIQHVDVVGGTSDAILLAINVSIFNPSNLKLSTGDLNLQLYRGDGLLGTTLLPNLTLEMGNNTVHAQGFFAANESPEGQQTLNDFVGKTDVNVNINGYDGSTKIAPLSEAFKSLALEAVLPGLKTDLLGSTSLKVLNTTGHSDNISHVTVDLVNPFTAGLSITQITSSVKSHGITLGSINQDVAFDASGHSTTTSPNFNLEMNLNPPDIFTVTRKLATLAGLGTDQLDGIVALGGYEYVTATDDDSAPARPSSSASNSSGAQKRDTNMYTGFNLPKYVDEAFKQLRADVQLSSSVKIGDYNTKLEYNQTDVPVATDESLNMLLPILAQPIVQKLVTQSNLGISNVVISDPQENSFSTQLFGSITNAGPCARLVDAKIKFGSGLTISWNGKPLGSIQMPDVNLAADEGAQLNISAKFSVADVGHLTDFTKVLLTQEKFEWEIAGDDLTVTALGIDVPGISLTTKKVSLLGMNGLKNGVVINSFDLPKNDPAGGIHLTLDTTVTNPAQVGIVLSTIGFQNFFQHTYIGPAASDGTFVLAPQSSVGLPLVGRLVPQNDAQGLADVSTIFNSFIHGENSTIKVYGDSAGPSDVTWLNEGIKSLAIQATLPNQGKLDIIKSITLNELQLMFSTDDAYDPPTSSDSAEAAFTIPFAFPINIVALEQNITVGYQGTDFAVLRVPKGPSTTDVDARIIHLTFNNTPFAVFDNEHAVFQQFLADTTTNSEETFALSGTANTDAQTAVGVLSLTDIEFDVTTSIAGLQGLNAKPATVSNLDVNHGFPDFLLIKVTTELFNPSNLTIGTGDVSFSLQFEDTTIGAALISNAVIIPGSSNYSTDVHYQPQGSAVPIGQQMLENFLQGVDSSTTIVGTMGTTPIDSLKLALSEIKLNNVVIPALHQNLITSASLTFPTDIVHTGIAQSTFTLSNPFTASININEVTATVTFQDIMLGAIDHQSLSFHVDGHGNATSQSLPFNFNLKPTVIIQLLLIRSQEKGVELGPLPDLFKIVLDNPDATTNINATVDPNSPTCVSGHQFDVNNAILNALAGMEVNLAVDSSVHLDEYATDLAFNQSNVPAITDKTALYLIGVVAPPIVQSLVDQAELKFTQANITGFYSNLSNDGFDLSLVGSLTGTGPLDAEIAFTQPVNVAWQGQNIATISLPAVCAEANSGVPNYQTSGHLSITDQDAFTSFATFLLHNEEFTWTISTENLRVTALGTIFDNVKLSKDVTLRAFNGLPGVTISNFKLPSDDPAGGIHIETDSSIPSPAQLGIDLGTVTFNAFFEDVLVGPLSGEHLTLPPQATVQEHLSGRIVPQSGSDLDTIGVLFSQFLAGNNQTLSVIGESVQPSGSGEVTWLSTAFKTLTLSVTLPGQKFTIIESITIKDLEVNMTSQDEAFAPLSSSQNTLATYKNPFGFSLQVVQSGENITLKHGGSDVATLNLPVTDANGGVSTGNIADLQLSFSNQPLTSINNGAFESFFAAVTDTSSVDFGLSGTANVVAKTSIGNVPISGIPFDVDSNLKGINSFGGTAQLSNVSIAGSGGDGGTQFIKSPLTTTLTNPSNISLSTNNIALPVFYKGTQLGRAAIDPFNLVPGENTIPTIFEYMPSDANDTTAQAFITEFVTTGDKIDLSIQGDGESSPYASLDQALEGVKISTSLTGINFPNLITHIEVIITLDTLFTNLVSVNFDVHNPLDAPLDIKFVQSDASVGGKIYAHFDQAFDNFVVPPKGTANSGTFGNVLLTQGAGPSLAIIPLGFLDIDAAQTVRIGVGGYEIPWMKISQSHVPTSYGPGLSISDMKSALNSISLAHASTLLHNATSLASGAISAATSVVGGVTSAVGSVASEVTSAVGHATSIAGDVTSALGLPLPSSPAHTTPAPAAPPSPTPTDGENGNDKNTPTANPLIQQVTNVIPSPTNS
ncbi:hypothetical protein K474DRAFT_1678619 [Panus rudis PR-1116 ss-1]|nr:hypothetical protein K474DRAFT_1678619 [Panus rudis PR-1116 ss-1]